MKFRKSHIWLALLAVSILLLALQLIGVAGGRDAELLKQAVSTEGEVQNTIQLNKTTENELNKAESNTRELKEKLSAFSNGTESPEDISATLNKKIQALEQQLQQRDL